MNKYQIIPFTLVLNALFTLIFVYFLQQTNLDIQNYTNIQCNKGFYLKEKTYLNCTAKKNNKLLDIILVEYEYIQTQIKH
jgi:hypothetical protein